MTVRKSTMLAKLKINVRTRLLSAILLLMPFGVTLLVMRWLFQWLAGFLRPMVQYSADKLSKYPFIEFIPDIYISICVSVCSIVILLVLLYFIGAIGQFVVGKRLIKAGETLLLRIPLVRTVYTATKQVAEAVSLPDRSALKSVVLVEFFKPGFKVVAFLTGYIEDSAGKKFCKVMIPTTPNPTSGFLVVVPLNEVTETTMTIEEAFKMIISGGIVSPDTLPSAKASQSATNSGKDK